MSAKATNVYGVRSNLMLGGPVFTYPLVANFLAEWGSDDGNQNYGTASYTDWAGLWVRDDPSQPWDFTGGGTAPVNQYGVLVEATASGSANFHAAAFGGNVNLRNGDYIYWGTTTATTLANADGTFQFSGDTWEWVADSSWGASVALRTIYADINTFSLPQHSVGLKNGTGLFWTTASGNTYANRTGNFYYDGGKFLFTSGATPTTILTVGSTIIPKVNIVPDEGVNFIFGTTTGTKFGQATNQKIGVWNATPVIQQSAYTQTYATADKTHAAFTSGDLTGITSSTTGTALAEPSLLYTQAEMQQNFRRIQDQYNLLRADLADLKQLVNSVIDDFQTIGWLG
jgi:hypothetical protein